MQQSGEQRNLFSQSNTNLNEAHNQHDDRHEKVRPMSVHRVRRLSPQIKSDDRDILAAALVTSMPRRPQRPELCFTSQSMFYSLYLVIGSYTIRQDVAMMRYTYSFSSAHHGCKRNCSIIREAMMLSNSPRNILLDICKYMVPADFVALSLVSRDLRDLVQPLLYSSIHITWTSNPQLPISQLLRSLLERPFLAYCVQHLQLDGPYSQTRKNDIANLHTLSNTVDLIKSRLYASMISSWVSPDTAHAWDNAIQEGNIDAIVALIIALLPNLRNIRLSETWTCESKFLGAILEASLNGRYTKIPPQSHDGDDYAPQRPTFKSLRWAALASRPHRESPPDQMHRRAFLAFFYLPSIQHLSVNIGNPVDFSWPFQVRPHPLNLTFLEISGLHERHLGSVLSVAPALKSLKYNWMYQQDIDDKPNSNSTVRLDTIAIAIAGCHTLESLEITAAFNSTLSGSGHEAPRTHFQSSLKHLSRLHGLKRMQLPWAFVMGMEEASIPDAGTRLASVIPPNIKHFKATGDLGSSDDYEWDETSIIESFAVALASGLKTRTKGLRSVCLPYPSQSGLSPDYEAKLVSLRFRYGIKFTHEI